MKLLQDALEKVRRGGEAGDEAKQSARSLFAGEASGRRRLLPGVLLAVALVVLVGLGGGFYLGLYDVPGLMREAQVVAAIQPTATVGQSAGSEGAAAQPATVDDSKATADDSQEQPRAVSSPAPSQVRPARRADSGKPRAAAPARPSPEGGMKIDAMLSLAWQAERQGDLPAAGRHYARAIEIEPLDRAAALGRARVHAQQGEIVAAERLYRGLLEQDPRDADALAGLALLRGMSDPAGWLARVESALEKRPDHVGLRAAQGWLYAERKEWLAAVRAYAEAARLDPTGEILYDYAVCLDRAGKHREALAAYRQALAVAGTQPGFDRRAVEARIDALDNHETP